MTGLQNKRIDDMAKKKEENAINLDNILFNCRDILRAARNSGSFFEKRDMMLTLVFLRFIGSESSQVINLIINDYASALSLNFV